MPTLSTLSRKTGKREPRLAGRSTAPAPAAACAPGPAADRSCPRSALDSGGPGWVSLVQDASASGPGRRLSPSQPPRKPPCSSACSLTYPANSCVPRRGGSGPAGGQAARVGEDTHLTEHLCAPPHRGSGEPGPWWRRPVPGRALGECPKLRAVELRSERVDSAGQRRGEDAKGVASAEVWRAGSPSYSLNRGAGASGRLKRGRG